MKLPRTAAQFGRLLLALTAATLVASCGSTGATAPPVLDRVALAWDALERATWDHRASTIDSRLEWLPAAEPRALDLVALAD